MSQTERAAVVYSWINSMGIKTMNNEWHSKDKILESANFAQSCEDFELLVDLSLSNLDSADLFFQAGDRRKSLLCRLKAEMFAARVEDLSKPLCSVCGTTVNVRNYYLNGNCWKCDSCDEWSWHEWRKLTYAS